MPKKADDQQTPQATAPTTAADTEFAEDQTPSFAADAGEELNQNPRAMADGGTAASDVEFAQDMTQATGVVNTGGGLARTPNNGLETYDERNQATTDDALSQNAVANRNIIKNPEISYPNNKLPE